MPLSIAVAREVPGAVYAPRDALLARHASNGALAERLGIDAAELPRRELERALLGPAATFLGRPGRGVRERLVALGWELGGGRGAVPSGLGRAVEYLHAGSLIVDDIQDGSRRRRGAPTLHVRYGVPLALNTGNWLYFWALELLAETAASPATELRLRRCATQAVLRCHYGQALDLGVRVDTVPRCDVPRLASAISELKTGGLTALAASLGAISAGATPARERAIARFALRLGVGLQMLDDLANLEGACDRSKRHEDLRLGRVTWPWAWLAGQGARAPYARLRGRVRAVVLDGASPARLARELARLLGDRGRSSADAWLARAVTGLRNAAPDVPLATVRDAVDHVRSRIA